MPRTKKRTKLHTLPCGCQYWRLNWMNNPQRCDGRLYLYTPLAVGDGKTTGCCTGTAHLKLVTTYDDMDGAKLCGNCSNAHICEHQPTEHRVHPATLNPQPAMMPSIEPVVVPADATEYQKAFVAALNKFRKEHQ
jgi:hypothetical protein